jgi:hypothetical protein
MAATSYMKFAKEVQDETAKAIEQAQDASLKLASVTWAALPELPTPAEAIESGFGFAGRVLELQKQYLLRLTGVAPPAQTAKG